MSSAASGSDHTVNKIAFYSAIFAGVAYVGYTVVKDAFKKKNASQDHDALLEYESHRRRIFLRRLSGSELGSTSFLLGNGSSNGGSSRLVLRPLSVQERIRELNLRARHFAETVMAVQLYDTVPAENHPPVGPRGRNVLSFSLQTSPTRNFMDPIDFNNLASSRYNSTENLFHSLPCESSSGLSSRWRSSRRSLRSRSPDFSKEELYESIEAESERLLDEREIELRKRLQGFEEGSTKILTPYEAKSLVALLHAKDCKTLERALVTISNASAFTQNQESLRDAGCLVRLQRIIIHSDRSVKLKAQQAVANLALNVENQKEMEQIVPLLLAQIEEDALENFDEKLCLQVLFTLTNIAALNDWHHHFIPALPNILELTDSSSSTVNMQSLRLLVNLSTNPNMIEYLQSAEASSYLWKLLDINQSEDKLLRVVTCLANIVCHSGMRRQTQVSTPTSDKSSTAFLNGASLISQQSVVEFENKLNAILAQTTHEDIQTKANQLLKALCQSQ